MRRLMIVALVCWACCVQDASAWNHTGHKLVALVAWEQLDEDERKAVVRLMKKHKRFRSDFKPDDNENVTPANKDKWIFAYAAFWPDAVRKTAEDRPMWHFINEPIFLKPSDRDHFKDNLPVNLKKRWFRNMGDSKDLNIVQALRRCMSLLKGDETRDADKAIALFWLFHLVGDLQQPFHSSALFSKNLLPKGDKGGGRIPVVGAKNLHAYWDRRLGSGKSLPRLSARARGWIKDDDDLRKAGEKAAENTDFDAWLKESVKLARRYGYTDQVLRAVGRASPGNKMLKMDKIDLSDQYRDDAEEVATRRIVEAGYRLAAVLRELGFGQ